MEYNGAKEQILSLGGVIVALESIKIYFSSSFIDHRSSPYARLPHIGENALEKISEGHRLGRRRPLSHLTKYFQK